MSNLNRFAALNSDDEDESPKVQAPKTTPAPAAAPKKKNDNRARGRRRNDNRGNGNNRGRRDDSAFARHGAEDGEGGEAERSIRSHFEKVQFCLIQYS